MHKQKEANVIGIATSIGLLVVVTQFLTLSFLAPSLTLQAEMFHAGSDFLVNLGAYFVALHALAADEEQALKVEKKFMMVGVAVLVVGALWTAYEAIETMMGVTRDINGLWVMLVGLIGGVGNYVAHQVLDSAHPDHRTSKHKIVHLHVKEDIALSFAVVVSGFLSLTFGLNGLDPYFSIMIVAWVLKRAWGIWKDLKAGKKPCCCPHDH